MAGFKLVAFADKIIRVHLRRVVAATKIARLGMLGTNIPSMGYSVLGQIRNGTAGCRVLPGGSFIAAVPRPNTVGWGWVQADDNGSEQGKVHRYNLDRPCHTA